MIANTHGGRRAGAGRPRNEPGGRSPTPHRTRPALSPNHPVHVVLRVRPLMPDLRRGEIYRALHRVLERYLNCASFRIVHISIQNTHLHLLVEADDKRALTAGMQSFAINAARAIHRLDGGCGKVFPQRYHATQITTARQSRNALAYVLNNWRKHREDWSNGRESTAKLDPYSSALAFTGWTHKFSCPSGYAPLPTSPPKTALLDREWRRFGRIDPFEIRM